MAISEVAVDVLATFAERNSSGVSVLTEPSVALLVRPQQAFVVAASLKNEPEFQMDMLSNVTAVDWTEYLELVYHLYSSSLRQKTMMKIRLDVTEEAIPAVPSMVSFWPSADFQEREIFDLMGVQFTGHPNLRRILLPEDFCGHPLRKSFSLLPRAQRGDISC